MQDASDYYPQLWLRPSGWSTVFIVSRSSALDALLFHDLVRQHGGSGQIGRAGRRMILSDLSFDRCLHRIEFA